MKYGGKLAVCFLAGFGSFAVAQTNADVPTTPYEQIITRNAFALKPLPTPPDPSELNKTPPPKITLSGITTVIGKRALLETPGPQPKPGQTAAAKLFYMLRAGEKEGDIEVLDIDEKAGSVRVRNGGQELTLTFEKDGAKLPATAAPAPPPNALPGVPPPPGFGAPPVKTAAATMPGGMPTLPGTFPTRTVRTANEAGFNPAGGMNPGYNPAYNAAGGVSMPSFSSATPLQTSPQLHEHGMTPEEQTIMMEAQRQVTQGPVSSGKLPPIPPTLMTPPGSPGAIPRPNMPPLPGSGG